MIHANTTEPVISAQISLFAIKLENENRQNKTTFCLTNTNSLMT